MLYTVFHLNHVLGSHMTKRFFIVLLACTTGFAAKAQPCIEGFAGNYPCALVDRYAEITNEQFGIEFPWERQASDIWGWTSLSTGREYAIVCLFNRTAFVDITSPEHPLYLGYLPTASGGILWRDAKVIDHWVYVVSESDMHGLQVFDLRRLETLSYAEIPVVFSMDAHYTGFGRSHNVVADTASKFIYAVGSDTFAGGLHIVDVSNPLAPQFAGSSSEDGYTHDAQVVVYNGPHTAYQGKQICFAANENTITIFDVSNKTDIQLLSRTGYNDVGYTHQCWLTADHRYLLANDELDEIVFEINTRTIIFDVQDLENPVPIGYVDLGTTSIDHNLYTHEGLVYMSNYTSGLRILSLKDVAQGELIPVGHFDVYPNGQPRIFHGSWSNYPYFDSGTVVATSIYHGLHILGPRFWDMEEKVLRVCGGNSVSTTFGLHIPVDGTVQYTVEYENDNGPGFTLGSSSSAGAPFQNSVQFFSLLNGPEGYYPGHIGIHYEDYERRIPFVIVSQSANSVPAIPELLSPGNGQVFPGQYVEFQWSDASPGYAELEIAVDENFENIVYTKTLYGSAPLHAAHLPFAETTYFWRLRKPTSCGADVLSEVGQFTIGDVLSNNADNHTGRGRFMVYPNPAHDMLMLQAPAEVRAADLYDLSGRKVRSYTLRPQTHAQSIAVTGLSPGIYILKAVQGGYSAKVVLR